MLSRSIVFRESSDFTPTPGIHLPPSISFYHCTSPAYPVHRGEVAVFVYTPLTYSIRPIVCLERSIFFGVKWRRSTSEPAAYPYVLRGEMVLGFLKPGPVQRPLNLDYELFNCSNFNICYWSWNYRGCWHQTFPPVVSRKSIYS